MKNRNRGIAKLRDSCGISVEFQSYDKKSNEFDCEEGWKVIQVIRERAETALHTYKEGQTSWDSSSATVDYEEGNRSSAICEPSMDSSHLLRTHDNCSKLAQKLYHHWVEMVFQSPAHGCFSSQSTTIRARAKREVNKTSSNTKAIVAWGAWSLLVISMCNRSGRLSHFLSLWYKYIAESLAGKTDVLLTWKKSRYRFHVRRTSGLPRDIAKIWTSSIRAFSQQGKQKECSELVHARSAVCIACISAARQAFGHMINYDAESHAVKHWLSWASVYPIDIQPHESGALLSTRGWSQ